MRIALFLNRNGNATEHQDLRQDEDISLIEVGPATDLTKGIPVGFTTELGDPPYYRTWY